MTAIPFTPYNPIFLQVIPFSTTGPFKIRQLLHYKISISLFYRICMHKIRFAFGVNRKFTIYAECKSQQCLLIRKEYKFQSIQHYTGKTYPHLMRNELVFMALGKRLNPKPLQSRSNSSNLIRFIHLRETTLSSHFCSSHLSRLKQHVNRLHPLSNWVFCF